LERARALLAEGRLEEARDLARALLDRPRPPNGAREVLGRVALAQGRAEAAEEILKDAAERESGNGALWVALGAARLTTGDLEGAEAAFERTLKTNTNPAIAMAGLAETRLRQGRTDEALDALRQALAGALTTPGGQALPEGGVLPPSLADAVASLAEGRRRAGRAMEAERLHRVALAGHGTCGPALVGLGALRAAGGHPSEAEDLYRTALEQGASPVEAALALAELKDGEGRTAVAAVLREAAALAARDPVAVLSVARALAAAGQYRSAATQFTRVTRAEPENVAARRGLIEALVAEGEAEDALIHLDRAAALDPRDPWPWRTRARILADQGRDVRAIAALRDCLERAPGDPEALKALALRQDAVKAKGEALNACVAALAASPLDDELKDLRARLLSERRYLDLSRSLAAGGALGRSRRVPEMVVEVLERLPAFRGLPWGRAACEQVEGGALGLGSLWRVRLGGADLLVRQPVNGVDGHGDEGRNTRLASDLGVAPPLLAFHAEDGGQVSLYPPGRPLTTESLRDRGVLGRLAQTLGRLHRGPVVFRGRLDMGAVLARREQALARSGIIVGVRDQDRIRAELPRVLRALAVRAPHSAPLVNTQGLHGFIDGSRQLLITDWATSAMGDPFRDLGVLANAGHLEPVPERVLLTLYLGRRAGDGDLARLRLHRFLDHYLCLLEALDAAAAMEDPHPLLDLAEAAALGCRERMRAADWEQTLALAAQ
jgi:tetratricopeptide (TPR) repeat protein